MLDGLIMRRMIWKARPCRKLTGMIDTDLVPISHVSGSHQFSRIFHEVIIFTIIAAQQNDAAVQCALHGSICSKCWLILHEQNVLCIRCHAHVPLCTQKQPFNRERCDLMHGHGWARERPQ